MPYIPTNWQDGVTLGTHVNMNNLETQYSEATQSLEQDLLTAFVLAGLVASKDATTATKLNVSAGTAFPLQADSTLRRRSLAATSFTTATPSTTYYLDLNPDGTWSFATSHSAQANYLPIAQVTTDGSSNISGVTDKRTTTTNMLSGQVGGSALALPVVSTMQAQPPQPGQYAGRIVGGVTSVSPGALVGSPDGAMSFNGSTGMILAAATGLPSGNAAWSMECWAKLTATPGAFVVCTRIGTDAGGASVTLGFTSAGLPYAGYDAAALATGPSTLSNGVWHHLVGEYDGAALRLYVDGAQVAINSSPGTLAVGTAGFVIGSNVSGNTNFFNGSIDEVAIYNAALSAGQVTTHYTRGTTGPSGATTYAGTILGETSLLRYYRLGDNAARGVANQAIAEHATTGNADGTISPIAVASVGGQPTAGAFGVPVIVAQALGVHITDTAFHNIVSFTPPSTGLYRCSMYVSMGNSGGAQKINASVSYTDPQFGGTYAYFTWQASTPVVMNGNNLVGNSQGIASFPLVVYATPGSAIFISYTDGAGTPNDYVSAIIERLT